MKNIKNLLLGNASDALRKGVAWNLVASLEYSFQSAVLILAVTRINGLYDAGIFTFAYTVAQMMTTIGNYGMRGFQVSDARNEYSFRQYFSSRIATALIMIGMCIICACTFGLTEDKGKLILILGGYRATEVIEDVLHGEMQKEHRLDVGAKIEAARISIATLLFVGSCLVTRDMVIASIVMTVCSLLIALFLNALVLKSFGEISFKMKLVGLYRLLWACLPICACDFLYNNLVNAPKYAIERNLPEESQAVFSILFMPVFVINMLSSFIYKPLMADMGIYWNSKKSINFFRIIMKQFWTIILLTLLVVAGGVVIGLDLLGYIYGVNLKEYKALFALLLGFGGIAAMDAFLIVVLTVMRKQQWAIVAYVISIICAGAYIDKAVRAFGLWGAGVLYSLSMGIVMLVLLPVVLRTLYKAKNTAEYK